MKQKAFRNEQAYRFKRFVRKAYAAYNSMHKAVTIGVISGGMLTFVHATETIAQSQPSTMQDSLPEQELDELIVTSSKAELTLNQTAKLVTVITKDEIARQPVQSVQDLLKSVVGLDVRQRGSNGVLSGISVRGGTFDQVAILLNGANISDPQTAHYSLDIPINLSDIERIEIIQGPSSLLYGASAFSGGINIITKKDTESNAYFNAEGGMHGLWGVQGRGAIAKASSTHSLSAGYSTSDGYMKNSDYEIFNALWQSRFDVEQSHIDVQAGFNKKAYGANTFFSPAYPNQYDDNKAIFASVKGQTGKKLKFIPQLYWNRHYNCFQLYRDGTPNVPSTYKGHNNHRTDVFGFNLNMQYKWMLGITNFGGEVRNEGIYSNVLGKPLEKPDGKYLVSDNRTNISYFLEHTLLLDRFTLGLGMLANKNTFLEEDFTFYPNISASYWLTEQLKMVASWNKATRMPTFTDLYYTGATHVGNSDLKPEKSEAFEVGLKYNNSFLAAYLTGFYMTGKDLIDWVKEKPEDLWESQNLTKLYKSGFETSVSLQMKELIPQLSSSRLDIGYMYLNQNKNTGDLISNYVLDYLKHKVTVGLYHPIYKNISANWQFRWQDRAGTYTQYIDLKKADEVEYPSFCLLDVKLNWKLSDFNVYLAANNLLDRHYYDLGNIPQPGFWLTGGVSYTIK